MKVHIIAKDERQNMLALVTLEEFKAEVCAASPKVREELFKLLAELRRADGSPKPSLHDRLEKYQDAGLGGIRDLASNSEHLADYGRQ